MSGTRSIKTRKSETLRNTKNVETLVERIEKKGLKWFGHVMGDGRSFF